MGQFLLIALAILCCSSGILVAGQTALSMTEASQSQKSEVPPSQKSPETGSGSKSRGKAKSDSGVSEIVRAFFRQEGAKQFGIREPQKEIRLLRIEPYPNSRNRRIARVQQQLGGGIPVFGSRATLVIKEGKGVVRVTGNLTPTEKLTHIKPIPTINWLEAVERAIDHYRQLSAVSTQCKSGSIDTRSCGIATQLLVFEPARVGLKTGMARLAWLVRLGTDVMFIDAHDGFLIYRYSELQSATNRLTYDMKNEGTGGHGVLVLNENGPIDGEEVPDDAFQAHEGAAKVYYFFKHLGRDINAPQESGVHTSLVDSKAKWHPKGMAYYAPNVPAAVDIVGHEFTHGVIQAITLDNSDGVVPEFKGELGAVNEGFADYFGAAIEDKDWTIGETLSDGPLRNMENPHAGGFDPTKLRLPGNLGQPDHYTEKVTQDDDICGFGSSVGESKNDCPHLNNGIFNKAAFLASAGGTHHGKAVTGIGSSKLAKILYAALVVWAYSPSDMKSTAQLIVTSCADLAEEDNPYQISAVDCAEVKNAFAAVGLPVP